MIRRRATLAVMPDRCEACCDGFRCELPAGHDPKRRHRSSERSTHPTYQSTWVVTWRSERLDEPIADAD